ncbi:MAG: SRPBCC domain-containing protein [Rhizobiaceae bacterium]|nr:SRPBCC domain-containing protein [Rhizobiaceae bacterium]
MNFTGEIIVRAPRGQVYAAMEDARFFASCVEGVRDLQEIDSTHYTAVMETRVAYIRFKFDVTVEITRMEQDTLVEAKVEGVPTGIVGRLTGTSRAQLEDRAEGTAILYSMDVALAGKLGALGQPVLKAKAREMEKTFASRMQAAFDRTGATA